MAWVGIAGIASVGLLMVNGPQAFTRTTDDPRQYAAGEKKVGSWGYVLLLVAAMWALTKLII